MTDAAVIAGFEPNVEHRQRTQQTTDVAASTRLHGHAQARVIATPTPGAPTCHPAASHAGRGCSFFFRGVNRG